MKITRTGRTRNHGPIQIAYSVPDIDVTYGESEQSGEFRVRLYHDEEQSGGGVHNHFVHISPKDFARIVKAVAIELQRNPTLCRQLSADFEKDITSLEQIKLSILLRPQEV